MRRPRLPFSRSEPTDSADSAQDATAATTQATPGATKPEEPAEKPPALSKVRFRVSRRLRPVGHWFGERARSVGRALQRLGGWFAGFSTATWWRIAAAVGLLALYLVIKFAPVPGVPCSISAYKECPPPDDAVALVPDDALLYGHLTLDRDSHQYELGSELAGDLPDFELLAQQAAAGLPTPSGARIDLSDDVLPWADTDLAVAFLPGPRPDSKGDSKQGDSKQGDSKKGEPEKGDSKKGRSKGTAKRGSSPLLIAGVGDRKGADDFIAKIAPRGKAKTENQGGATLDVYPDGFAAAYIGDQLAIGTEGTVRRAMAADAGKLESLGEDGPRGELPEVRFAELYISRAGVRRLLDPKAPGATQLDTFVDVGASTGLAASATARDDGIELNLISDLDPKLLKKSPAVFPDLPGFDPELTRDAGADAIAYVGVGDLGPTVIRLLERAGGAGLAKSLRSLAKDVKKQAGVNPLADLLPALSGQAALIVEPTDSVPFASLIVDDVDEDRASTALAKLQSPLLKALRGSAKGRVLRFDEKEVDGVSVRSVPVSGTVNLSYAIFDDKLVVSTAPAGIEQVRAGGNGLADAEVFDRATNDLPDDPAALVFLNLDELLGLAEQAGLAEDPLYASLSDDISQIASLGLAVTGDDEEIRSEMFVAID